MATISVSDLLHLSVTEAQKKELDRRLAEHKANPGSAIPWDEFRTELRERFP